MHKAYFILIMMVAFILAITKIAMDQVKKEDKKKGLELDDKSYSIRGTLFSSRKQEKRLEKKEKFSGSGYDKDKWKKVFLIYFGAALLATLIGYIFHLDFLSTIIAMLFGIFIYTKRSIVLMCITDFYMLIQLLDDGIIRGIPILITIPMLIMTTALLFGDYKDYKNNSKNICTEK